MKFFQNLLIFLFCTVAIFSSKAQTDTIQPQKWYTYLGMERLMSISEHDDKFILDLVSNDTLLTNSKAADTIHIIKKLDENHFIIQKSSRSNYGLLKRTKFAGDEMISVGTYAEGETLESVEKKYNEGMLPSWKSLEERYFYSKYKIEKLKNAPGLDQITRKDLLTSLQWRKPLGEKLKMYLEDSNGERTYRVHRFVKDFRNRKFIELGYNPYLDIPYNFEKQFEGDEEVQRLLTEEISFD